MTKTNENRLASLSAAAFAAVAPLNPVLLLPLGSFEDHGMMPMGDYQLAEILAGRIAEACAARGMPCYAAPALPFGVADYFGSSTGGLAISAANFRGVLHDLLAGLLRHGLTRIIILNGHGGNVPVIHEVTLAVSRAGGPVIPALYLWKLARLMMERRLGEGEAGRFGHGGEPLMSINFALHGPMTEVISPAKQGVMLGLPVSGFGTLEFCALPVEVPVEFDVVADAGAGAFASASAELGEAVVDELVAYGAAFATHLHSQT